MATYQISRNMPVNNVETKTENDSSELHQNFILRILNDTKHNLSLIKESLPGGVWDIKLPAMVMPKSSVEFGCKVNNSEKIEGCIEYSILHADFSISWELFDIGYFHYKLANDDPKSLYNIHAILKDEGPSRRDVLDIRVEEKYPS